MGGWRHVLWCSTAQTHVIKVGWSLERFGGQAIWQTCSRSGTPFWSSCTQDVPACSVHLHFCLQFTRMISMGRLNVIRLANLWTHRTQCLGCLHGMVEACRAIAVDRCAPCKLSGLECNVQFLLGPRSLQCTLWKLEISNVPRVYGHDGCLICDHHCAQRSLASWHLPGREIMAHSLEEWFIALWRHALCSLISALDSGQDGLGCCTFGRRWSLPELQGGPRRPHAPLVVLPRERAVHFTVELVGPCSCQLSRFLDSHSCAYRNPAGRLGHALPGRVQVSLELLVVLCC